MVTVPVTFGFPERRLKYKSPEAALVRELHEELGIVVQDQDLEPFWFLSHDYAAEFGFHLLMPVFACRKWIGTPQSREGQALRWVMPIELSRYPMPPADVPLVGLETVRTLADSGGRALALEADKTLLMDRDDVVRFADEKDISIVII